MAQTNTIDPKEIRHGLTIAAKLVKRYGPMYWPIVERLQNELETIEAREALLDELLNTSEPRGDQANFG